MITVVAIMCQLLGNIAEPVCREEVVTKTDGDSGTQVCMLGQAALAQWKTNSIYRDDKWFIQRVLCVPGDYVMRNAT